MSDYKSTIKSNVQSVELQKKKVKITCHNAKAGNLVITSLSQNAAIFDGKNYDIDKGIDGAKDFHVKFKDKDHAQKFYDNVMAIITDNSVEVTEAEKSGWQNFAEKAKETAQKVGETVKNAVQTVAQETAPEGVESAAATTDAPVSTGDSKKIMIIGGAVAVVLVLGVVLWLKK